jgi:hypothetical protein
MRKWSLAGLADIGQGESWLDVASTTLRIIHDYHRPTASGSKPPSSHVDMPWLDAGAQEISHAASSCRSSHSTVDAGGLPAANHDGTNARFAGCGTTMDRASALKIFKSCGALAGCGSLHSLDHEALEEDARCLQCCPVFSGSLHDVEEVADKAQKGRGGGSDKAGFAADT